MTRLLRGILFLACAAFITAPSARAGQRPVGVSEVDGRALLAYRLTPASLGKMQAAGRAFARALKTDAAFKSAVDAAREHAMLDLKPEPNDAEVERITALERLLARDPVRLDRVFNGGSLAEVSGRIARVPALARSLKGAGLTPLEFVTFERVASLSVWEGERRKAGVTAGVPVVSAENIAFAATHRARIERLRLAWLPFWD